jgi:hypothetical protein
VACGDPREGDIAVAYEARGESAAQRNLLSFDLHGTSKKSEKDRDMWAETRWKKRGESMLFRHRRPETSNNAPLKE